MGSVKLPFQRHLEWLLLEGRSEDEIAAFYDSIQFPRPADEHFEAAQDRIDSLIVSPAAKRRLARGQFSGEDAAIWGKYEYKDLYLKTMGRGPDWSGVGKVLSHPVMRVALECCLIVKVPAEELTVLLPQTFGIPLTESDIALYRHYLFDHEKMTLKDWRAYFNILVDDQYTYTRLYAALTKPRDEVVHMVGLPSKLQFSAFLKNVMATADYKFRWYSRQNSEEGDAQARRWASIGIEAGVKHEKFSASDATDFSKFIQTEFQYVDGTVETVSPEMLAEAKPQLNEAKSETGPKGAVPLPAPGEQTAFDAGENDQNRV